MTATANETVTLEDDLGLGEYNPESVEKEMENGGRLPIGKYHVALTDVGEQQATSKGVLQTPLKFTVLAGPCKGQTHTERVNDFVPGATEDNKKKSNNRWLLFASRLGLVSTAGGKYAKVRSDFAACVGADCVIEIKHEPRKDKSGNVVPGEPYSNITFAGVWNVSDPKVKDVVKAAPGERPAAVKASQPQYNMADL